MGRNQGAQSLDPLTGGFRSEWDTGNFAGTDMRQLYDPAVELVAELEMGRAGVVTDRQRDEELPGHRFVEAKHFIISKLLIEDGS
jgi:hypothetical protein